MQTWAKFAVALGILNSLAAGRAMAQAYRPPPAVSPYLNILRGGQGPGLNYYNLVRPEVEFRGAIQQLQTQNATTSQALAALESTSGLPTTGHRTGFMNYSQYFLNSGATGRSFSTTGQIPNRAGAPLPTSPTSPNLLRR
jgi:hypothetical protein